MSARLRRRAALLLVLVLGGCGAGAREVAVDLGTKAGAIVARAVVRAAGLCDDAPAPSSGGADVWPRPAGDASAPSGDASVAGR